MFENFLFSFPKLYVKSRSGTKSPAKSAAKTILSVSSSPKTTLPSNVMFPVACKLPFTSTLE